MADFEVRGFAVHRTFGRTVLQTHARAFLHGFNTVLAGPDIAAARQRLADPEWVADGERGFAFEGAGMATALLDILVPSRTRRVRALLDGAGARYPHLIHVGTGWALAYARVPGGRARLRLDPLIGWLALDGWGFARGFFGGHRVVRRFRAKPEPLTPADQVRCQGLGRCLWFVEAADPVRIAAVIAGAPAGHRAHLWSGVGLAAAYAGGSEPGELTGLAEAARNTGPYAAELAQGAAFAAEARRHAGHVPPHTEAACAVLTGVDAQTAAGWTRRAAENLRGDDTLDGYLSWRAGIRAEYDRARASAAARRSGRG